MSETLNPIIDDDIEDKARHVLRHAQRLDVTLATAESCTGGLLASLLTDIEGLSHVFERGFIVYSERAKSEMLDVPLALIAQKGAVSREVAIAMARGAIARSGAALAVAITGFAGKGDVPGLVHFGCVARAGQQAHRVEAFGDMGRGPIRLAALRVALEMFADALDQIR